MFPHRDVNSQYSENDVQHNLFRRIIVDAKLVVANIMFCLGVV